MNGWQEEQTEMLESILDYNPLPIGICDPEGNFTRINPVMVDLLSYSADEMRGKSFISFVAEEDRPAARKHVELLEAGDPISFQTSLVHRGGYRVEVLVTGIPHWTTKHISGFILIFRDITEQKQAEEQMRHLAYYDDMTGLPNRRMFKEMLEEAILSAKGHQNRVAVLYVDVDGFKLVNDCFGYDYGDMLLHQVASRFTSCVSEQDFIARTEGDEFAFYYTDVKSHEEVWAHAEAILKTLDQPFILEQYELHIKASIGISMLVQDEDASTLMKSANIALTRAKEEGKGEVRFFNEDMKLNALNKLKLENELRRALTNNEFMLYYQPQVHIQDGRIVGMEALIRWNHPVRGYVSPGDFIPYAEESGLIIPISEWVLREACRQNKAWQDAGLPRIAVSVNLSSRQFLQHNLGSKVAQVLDQTGLSPEYLELEITESMTMDVDHAINSLLELKKLGVGVSIDDFGTGYSSLYYLKKFPIDKLKIDRSFVRDIMEDPNDAAIVATIISMTRHLNLRVIAEGVENEEQLNFLHNNRCDEVQGFWFSPPVEARIMENMLKQQKTL